MNLEKIKFQIGLRIFQMKFLAEVYWELLKRKFRKGK